MERLLTSQDIVTETSVSIETARAWMNMMPCIKVGRIKRVRESVFVEFLVSHEQEQSHTTDARKRKTERSAVKKQKDMGLLNADGTLRRRRG